MAGSAEARGLTTGITDPLDSVFAERDGIASYHVAYVAGARVVRVPVTWANVVSRAPAQATDPADPAYDWTYIDDRVDRIVANGLEPILSVTGTPRFARKKQLTPNADDFAAFMTAIARRYDGTVKPRVRFFQLWNEPNLRGFLDERGAARDYREMVVRAYPAIHAVHADNVVVAGGLAPFAGARRRYGVAPLRFMRRLFAEYTPFDVWSHHPYTSGGPAHEAYAKDDASLGDLPEVRAVLARAKRAGRVDSTRMWVTEFSWDTKPPDPYGVPVGEHARWVAEALYRMWRSGVELVVWLQLRDNPSAGYPWGQTFQSGLYYRTTALYSRERAKPALRAFRFPFVALPRHRGGATLWGRTPASTPARVLVQRRTRRGWRALVVLTADAGGIFRGSVRVPRGSALRARLGRGETSRPFAVRRTRDRRVNPFGGDDPEVEVSADGSA